MSLLLDALQRASKDKERATLAAANATATAADTTTEPSTEPAELTLQHPPAANVPAQRLELELTPKPPPTVPPEPPKAPQETPPPPEPVRAPPPAPAPRPEPPTPVAPAPVAPAAAPTARANAGIPPNGPRNDPAGTPTTRPPVPADTQAAANAIRKGYAQPSSNKTAGRRAWILGGLAACIAVGLGSFLFGLWGNPERLLGLTGPSSLSSGSPAAPAPEGAASSAALTASAPLETVVEANSAPIAPIAAIVPMAPTSAPATGASTAAVLANAAASASTARIAAPRASPGKGPAVPPAPKAPIFSTNVTGQSPLEQGYTALVAGRLDDAALAYNAALANNPLEPDALLGLAYVAHSKGRREEALALYSKVLRVEPSNSVAQAGLIALDAGAAGATKGDRAKALVANQPDSAAAQALAASALAHEGLVAEAALAFGRAHALEPANPWHSYNLAVALDKLGNYAQAIDQYDKALQNAGNAPSPMGTPRVQSIRLRLAQLRDLPDPDSGTPR